MHEWEGLTYKARGRGSNTERERFHAWEACVGPVWDPGKIPLLRARFHAANLITALLS